MNLSYADFVSVFGSFGDLVWQNLYSPVTLLLLLASLFFLWMILSPRN